MIRAFAFLALITVLLFVQFFGVAHQLAGAAPGISGSDTSAAPNVELRALEELAAWPAAAR